MLKTKIKIISGKWKNSILNNKKKNCKKKYIRPTLSRIKKKFFSLLNDKLKGSKCFDLFSGSGSLGFEAASRGAKYVLLTENNFYTFQQLKFNKIKLFANNIQILKINTLYIITKISHNFFDFIFFDPPFNIKKSNNVYYIIIQILKIKGFLYIETNKKLNMTNKIFNRLLIIKYLNTKNVHYYLLQKIY